MKKDKLKDFFSSPREIALFLRENLSESLLKTYPFEYLLNQVFVVKNYLKRTHEIEKIIGFDDELLEITKLYPSDQLPALVQRIDDFIDWEQPDLRTLVIGYLFFPSELIEAHTPLPVLFLDFSLHWKLAYAARYGHALGRFYFSKLLEHFGVFTEKSALFLKMAQDQFEKVSSREAAHPYLRGLAFKYLDKEPEAVEEFRKGETSGHIPAVYELAKIMDKKGEEGVLAVYKKSSQYPLALLGVASYSETDHERFQSFKAAGQSGIREGYYQVAKMIEEGFVIPASEEPKSYKEWLLMAAENGSPDAFLKLAQDSEQEGSDAEALKYYEALSETGNLKGYLEQGRILENHGLYDQAKKVYEKASWLGLYEVARLETSLVSHATKEKAQALFITHFDRLIKIAEGIEEDE